MAAAPSKYSVLTTAVGPDSPVDELVLVDVDVKVSAVVVAVPESSTSLAPALTHISNPCAPTSDPIHWNWIAMSTCSMSFAIALSSRAPVAGRVRVSRSVDYAYVVSNLAGNLMFGTIQTQHNSGISVLKVKGCISDAKRETWICKRLGKRKIPC